jgi:predicted enzyme related to lactoylglutathione lyase
MRRIKIVEQEAGTRYREDGKHLNKTVDKIIMFNIGVSDMDQSKAFYLDRLGLKVTNDIGQGNMHWVTLGLPGGGASLVLTTAYGNFKPGTMVIQFSTSDIQAAYKQLNAKDAKATGPIIDDFHGPGSGVKGFEIDDPDGNHLFIVQ